VKFKLIFTISNIALFLFLILLGFIPYFIMGPSFSVSFWKMNWPLILGWVILIIGLNIFFLANRKLFSLLEKEDWPALIGYLEEKVIQKGNYSSRLVRLLANCYLVLSDSVSVMSLENKVAINKPALLDANALIFGTARILGNDNAGALHFFKTRKDSAKAEPKDWVAWYYGFSLLLNKQTEDAVMEFSLLAASSRDGVVTALSSYFLERNIHGIMPQLRQKFREISELGRKRALDAMPKIEAWKREINRLSTEIFAAAIAGFLEDTRIWLYS
jgi:hypothetical protein